MRTLTRALALSGLALAALAGCGSDDTSSNETSPTAASVATTVASAASTTVAGRDATTADTTESAPATEPAPTTGADTANTGDTTATSDGDAPQRIVSLSPSATETLFAIGAGDQVIAVDDQSNFPEEAAAVRTDLSGFTPNIEAIAAFEPDLVVHDGTQDLSGLDALGIGSFAAPAPSSFDDLYAQIEQLGAVTGRVGDAAELVGQMQTDVRTAVDSVEVAFEVAPRIYHELDATLFSITSNTFVGQIYGLFGLQNIADTAEGGSDYPQLSAEFVISQNPDIIFLADADYGESPETVAARPGWAEITAVETDRVVPVSADVASRWGPRIVEYVEVVAETVNALAPATTG